MHYKSRFRLFFILFSFLTLMVPEAFECKAKDRGFIVNYKVVDRLTRRGMDCVYIVMEQADSSFSLVSEDIGRKGEFSIRFRERPRLGQYQIKLNVGNLMETYDPVKGFTHLFNPSADHEPTVITVFVPEDARSPYDAPQIRVGRPPVRTLDDFTVTATKVMFYHKGDTLIYNADAFVTAEGSMLDALLKQMPGVELAKNGQITVNGRLVDRLLLNGKDLFNGKHELMLENLGAYMVKDVAVYDKRGRKGELMGYDSGDNMHVMDVRLKRKYRQGLLGFLEGGYGTRLKYIGRLFGMWFSDNVSVSAYANSNNMSDTFVHDNDTPSFWMDRNNGVKTSHMAGMTYTASGFADKWELKGEAGVQREDEDGAITTSAENFLESGTTFGRTLDRNEFLKRNVRTSHEFFLKLGGWGNLEIRPQYEHNDLRTLRTHVSATGNSKLDEIGDDRLSDSSSGLADIYPSLLNRMLENEESSKRYNLYDINVKNNIRLSGGLNPTSLSIEGGATYYNVYNKKDLSYFVEYNNRYTDMPSERKNYLTDQPQRMTSAWGQATLEPYIRNWRIRIPVSYRFLYSDRKISSDVYSAGPEEETSQETPELYFAGHADGGRERVGNGAEYEFQPQLSYGQTFGVTEHSVRLDVVPQGNLIKSRRNILRLQLSSVFSFRRNTLDFISDDAPQRIVRDEFNPDVNMNVYWESRGKRRLNNRFTVNYKVDPVKMEYMTGKPSTDPVVSVGGNTGLKRPKTFLLSYNGKIPDKQSTTNFSGSVRYVSDPVLMMFEVDESTGRQTFHPVNMDDQIRAELKYHMYRRFGSGKFYYILKPETGWSTSGGTFYNRQNRVWVNEEFSLGRYGTKYRAGVFFNTDYDYTKYSGDNSNSYSIWRFNYGGEFTMNLPKNWSMESTLNIYTRRGYSDPRYDRTEFIWNAAVMKSFFKGKLLFKLEGYDMLRQLSNISYQFTDQSRIETVSNFIPNYFMLHIRWNFKK